MSEDDYSTSTNQLHDLSDKDIREETLRMFKTHRNNEWIANKTMEWIANKTQENLRVEMRKKQAEVTELKS